MTEETPRWEALCKRARGALTSQESKIGSEAAELIQELVRALEDDIVHIKEYAPQHLNNRVEQYRRRTHKAEETVDAAREVIERVTCWWRDSPEDSWRVERDMRLALRMDPFEEED